MIHIYIYIYITSATLNGPCREDIFPAQWKYEFLSNNNYVMFIIRFIYYLFINTYFLQIHLLYSMKYVFNIILL